METPKIVMYGQVIQPKPPKMRVWREFLAFFDLDKKDMDIEEYLDKQVELIVLAFNRPEVTKETLDECMEIGDIVPLSRQLFKWIQSLTFSKLVNVPNEAAEKD